MDRKERTLLIAIAANIILIFLRFFLAEISGSIGLVANAWHSFTDVFVSGVVLTGIFAARIFAARFVKIYGKIENVLAIFVAVFILFMGIEILADALSRDGTELRYVPFVAAGALLGIGINYFMARYKIYVGEQVKSQSLMADGYHSKMDMYCSIAVLVGIVGSLFGMSSLDKIAAVVAMVFLGVAGFEILITNLRSLLGSNGSSKAGEDCPAGHRHIHLKASKKTACALLVICVSGYVMSGIYLVGWDEVGIAKRFGAVANSKVEPGLHYNAPYPFGDVTLVKTGTVRRIDVREQMLLTGDANLLNVRTSVQYKIDDALKFTLNVSDLDGIIRSAASAGVRSMVGANDTDWLLTTGRDEVQERSRQYLQAILDRNETGVRVLGVQLLELSPPEDVKPSFQDLASAMQDKATYINEALAYRNTLVPQAKADAYALVRGAEGYKEEKIRTADGDAQMFSKQVEAYLSSKNVTQFRLYMEAMDKILPNVQKILVAGNIKVDNVDLWINNVPKKPQ